MNYRNTHIWIQIITIWNVYTCNKFKRRNFIVYIKNHMFPRRFRNCCRRTFNAVTTFQTKTIHVYISIYLKTQPLGWTQSTTNTGQSFERGAFSFRLCSSWGLFKVESNLTCKLHVANHFWFGKSASEMEYIYILRKQTERALDGNSFRW